VAALGRFIARSGEKALPFFKLMKRTGKFKWTPEADKAFVELKRYLTYPRCEKNPGGRTGYLKKYWNPIFVSPKCGKRLGYAGTEFKSMGLSLR
jgi:hypothetical protein